MLVETILGNLSDGAYEGLAVDRLDIEWFNAFKKIHRGVTAGGREVALRLGDEVLTRGLRQDDVLCVDGEACVAVNIPPCEVIVAEIEPGHGHALAKVCYEIGNKHAPLFFGERDNQFITPFNEPTNALLGAIHGVRARVETRRLDFSRSISGAVHAHTH